MTARSLGSAFFLLAIFVLGLLLLPGRSYAADLNFSPAAGSVAVGDTVSIKITLDPSGDSVNAADGTISFDSSMLAVSSITKDGSAFSLWTADPTYSNSAGTISFSGGTPTAFSSSKTILTIVFKGKAKGTAVLSVTKGSVLAADGKGTDVYKNGGSATVEVSDAAPVDTLDTGDNTDNVDASGDGATPIAPIISSLTNPKPANWYSTTTAVLSWLLPPDVTSVRVMLSDTPSTTPATKNTIPGGATSTQTVTGLKEGVSYYLVQFKNDAGWGLVGSFTLQIDLTPPSAFSVALQQSGSDGGPSKLAFKTDDALSGLDHYEIILGTSSPLTVLAKDVADGTYPVPPQPGGQQHITLKAFDKAGNFATAEADLNLPFVAAPKPASASTDETAPAPSGFGAGGYLAVLFALITGSLIAWSLYSRKIAQREKERLLQAVLEVRDKNDRIFSAMREEFEQLINDYDEKPQLTPEERELLEQIKEVLDISEELVDTGIEDLKKLVRNQQ